METARLFWWFVLANPILAPMTRRGVMGMAHGELFHPGQELGRFAVLSIWTVH